MSRAIRKKSRASYFRYAKNDMKTMLTLIHEYGNNNEDTLSLGQIETETVSSCTDSDCSLLNDSHSDPERDYFINKTSENLMGQTTHQIPGQIFNGSQKQTECKESDVNMQLKIWAIAHNIDHSALGGLLKILKPHFHTLPSDARTLLHTPRQTVTKIVHPGEYYHFGLEQAVNYLLANTSHKNITNCEVCVNVDGLPLTKSSGSSFYPILISLYPVENLIGIVGLYHGYEKPQDPNLFLRYFVDDAVRLTENGILFNNHKLPFRIRGFICDAPAKSYVKCIKSHTGYFSCSKCFQEGEFLNNRVCFPEIYSRERTDADFFSKVQEEHHIGTSILQEIPNFGLVSSFPLDYMHLLCLGVMKKMLVSLWVCGKPPFKLSSHQVTQISDSLKLQSPNIPAEFCRKPRSLHEVKRWKATEFRQFLLYTGPVVLKYVLDKRKYLNFLSLHVAVRILCSNNLSQDKIEYAHSLMIFFVKTFATLYGNEFISHNIHNLLHISRDVHNFGALDNFSAFPFENYMQVLKKFIRKSEKPLSQVVRRIVESEKIFTMKQKVPMLECRPFKEHQNGPLIGNCQNPQFLEYNFIKFKLKVKHPDNCCRLKDGSIIIVENFASSNGHTVVIGRKFEHLENFFIDPCESLNIQIFEVNGLSSLMFWPIDAIDLKYVKLTLSDSFVVLPLLHLDH